MVRGRGLNPAVRLSAFAVSFWVSRMGEDLIMPNLPWDLLASRLGRYLQLSYVSAALAGFCLVGEIIIRNLKGTPAHR